MSDRSSLTQWLASQQLCPRCQRALNVEHVAIEEPPDGRHSGIVLLFCDDCNRGFEVLLQREAGFWYRQFHLEHGPHNNKEFAKFKERLTDATGVAA